MRKLNPYISDVFTAIKVGLSAKEINEKIDQTLKTMNAKVCRTKMKLDESEAASRIGRYPKSVSFYFCGCGWIHAGHPVKWVSKAKAAMKSPEYCQIQHVKSVKKQQSKLKPPPKMK